MRYEVTVTCGCGRVESFLFKPYPNAPKRFECPKCGAIGFISLSESGPVNSPQEFPNKNVVDVTCRRFNCTCGSTRVITLWAPNNPDIDTPPHLIHRCVEAKPHHQNIIKPLIILEGTCSIAEGCVPYKPGDLL